MVKYFVPDEVLYEIKSRVQTLKFDNNYNKVIFDFNSDDMDLDVKIKHSILKLQHSVENNMYSTEIEELCDLLISSFKDNSTLCVYEFDERAEPLFLSVVAEKYSNLKAWFSFEDRISSRAMDINYRIKLESYKFIRKIDCENINLQEINDEYENYIKEFKPFTWFVNDLKSLDSFKIHISMWDRHFEVNTNLKNIVFNEDSIIFEFGCGRYKFNNSDKIYPTEIHDLVDGEPLWAYELDDFVTLWCRK